MVMYAAMILLRGTNFLADDIRQLPAMSEAITDLVARIVDPHINVSRAAVHGFIELAKHGNVHCY